MSSSAERLFPELAVIAMGSLKGNRLPMVFWLLQQISALRFASRRTDEQPPATRCADDAGVAAEDGERMATRSARQANVTSWMYLLIKYEELRGCHAAGGSTPVPG